METSEKITASPGAPKVRKKGGLGETARFLLLIFLFALLLRSLLFAPFSIPSGSMLPRMMIGDYLFVAKWPYGYSRHSFPFGLFGFEGRLAGAMPERGDIVVFRYPGNDRVDYVKRVIGLPGDTIQLRGGQVILNGDAVPRERIADYRMAITPNSPCRSVVPDAARVESGAGGSLFCAYPRYRETLPGGRSYEVLDQIEGPADNTPVYLVPEGHYFVMGDNRDDSQDSRFALAAGGVGYLPEDHLVGRAMLTFFSTDGSAEWLKPWTWFTAARWERIGSGYR